MIPRRALLAAALPLFAIRTLAGKGAFRAALQASSFYAGRRARFGDQAWAALQSVSGDLA